MGKRRGNWSRRIQGGRMFQRGVYKAFVDVGKLEGGRRHTTPRIRMEIWVHEVTYGSIKM